MKNLLLILFVAATIIGCNETFDSNKWKEQGTDWWITDVREVMLEDLISSDTLIGKDSTDIINLLGEPEARKDDNFEYLVREKYKFDIDPVYIKHLIIELDNDGRAVKAIVKI